MNIIKDPNLITKNMRTLKGIYYILNNKGECSRKYCNPCIFNTSSIYSTDIDYCVWYDIFNKIANNMQKGSCYYNCRMYYCLQLLTLYNNAEKLSVLIQDI